MPEPATEPRNPFYLLLLVASLFFLVTALAYALMPLLEEDAIQQGQEPAPPSALRTSIVKHGWVWLAIELTLMILFAFASMILDKKRLRRLQTDHDAATIPSHPSPATTAPMVPNDPGEADREAPPGDRKT